MKKTYIFLIVYFSLLIKIQSSTSISFSASGEGYTVSDNIVTISNEGTYDLSGEQTNAKIIISASCTLNLNSFSIFNMGELTPIVISPNKEVNIVLTGESSLTDSSTNENNGTIYLQSGASLTISGTGSLDIYPNKFMAINGTEETSLTINDGASITIASTSTDVGGIYLRKAITLNNAKLTYYIENGAHHAIDSEGNIKIVKGEYYLTSGNGKGIQSEKNLYIGEENGDNSDLTLSIDTLNEGIEAMKIEIYSGSIQIISGEDGINSASSGTECDSDTVRCSGNCACYITFKGGIMEIQSGEDGLDSNGDITITGGQIKIFAASEGADQPIDQDGLLSITGGAVIAAGSSEMEGGVNANTNQTAKVYKGTINQNSRLVITDSNGFDIIDISIPKAANYIYFNYKSSFTVKLDDVEINLTDPTQNNTPGGQGGPGGEGQNGPGGPGGEGQNGPGGEGQNGPGGPGGNNTQENNNFSQRYFFGLLNIILIFGLIIL